MAALKVSVMILSVMLAIPHYSQAQFPTKTLLLESTSHNNNNNNNPFSENLTVFEKGKYQVTKPINVMVNILKNSAQPLLLVSPKEAGFYPVLFFIHGTMISNEDYSNLFQHIASHGYIVVAPQFFTFLSFDQTPEIKMAASLLEWLPSHLQEVLHEHVSGEVKANIKKLAISGHSRGGKSAFALALGIPKIAKLSTIKISALIGVDPVAGLNKDWRTKPYVLTNEKNSLNISIPVAVIGTGLGSHGFWPWPPCAPSGVSHQEFYNECKKGSHFVIEEYGHMQMLDDQLVDWIPKIMSLFCAHGNGLKSTMRRTLGGIMVAFLDAYLGNDKGQYFALMNNASLAPTKLSVEKKGDYGFAPTYVQV